MSEFAAATSVRRTDADRYAADLHPGWAIGGKPNGGYSLALIARAACHAAESPGPLAVSAHYLRAPDPGPADVHVEVVRRGRRVSTVRATLWQADRPCIEALVSCGAPGHDASDWDERPPPDLPPPQECVSGAPPKFHVELMDRLDLRLDPATAPFPKPSGRPELRGWFRFADDAKPDVFALLLAVDAFPPTVFNLRRYGWAPTVELTTLIRGTPAPGWLRVHVDTALLAGGWFDENATVWDSSGRLVAQSRQLALVGS